MSYPHQSDRENKMKAMILAAGRGKRMGELTTTQPKPLLKVGSDTLIEHQIKRLQQAGYNELVVNLGYLGEQIQNYLGDGQRYGVRIAYSTESQSGLETGGGVYQALPLLGDKPFLLTNADIFCDYPYQQLKRRQTDSVHLVLVDNPAFKSSGDFSIIEGKLTADKDYTFSGISIVNPEIFKNCQAGFFPIAPLFHQSIAHQTATAEHYDGVWFDVGTPERLMQVNQFWHR